MPTTGWFLNVDTYARATPTPLDRSTYPTVGAGVHFVFKPVQRMNVNVEYA